MLGLIFTICSPCFFTSTYPPLSMFHAHIAHTSACPAPTCFFFLFSPSCACWLSSLAGCHQLHLFFSHLWFRFSETAGKLWAGRRLMTQIIETNGIWPQSDVLRGIKQQRKQVYIRHKTWPKSLNLGTRIKGRAIGETIHWLNNYGLCYWISVGETKLINEWLKKTWCVSQNKI